MKFKAVYEKYIKNLNEDVTPGKYHLTVTYEVVTPESAEQGDVESSGIDDEMDFDNLHDLIDELTRFKSLEPSSSYFHPHVWYIDIDADIDYRTGAETRKSYHIDGASEDEQKIVWESVKRGMNLVPDPMDVEEVEKVKTENGYDFYVGSDGFKDFYNIVPAGSPKPTSGYFSKEYIEKVKNQKFDVETS